MYDVSEFMKAVKQRYSMSFNYENEHYGTMWEGRFKAVHVQATQGPMSAVAAYDDLNPLRAGAVRDLSEYPWCSWYAAMQGDELARDSPRPSRWTSSRPSPQRSPRSPQQNDMMPELKGVRYTGEKNARIVIARLADERAA